MVLKAEKMKVFLHMWQKPRYRGAGLVLKYYHTQISMLKKQLYKTFQREVKCSHSAKEPNIRKTIEQLEEGSNKTTAITLPDHCKNMRENQGTGNQHITKYN